MSGQDTSVASTAPLGVTSEASKSLPTKQIVSDLRNLALMRKFTILSSGPPVLRVQTVGRCGWYPEWQHTNYPGCKLINLPNFFARYVIWDDTSLCCLCRRIK